MTSQPVQFQAENVRLTTRVLIPIWIARKTVRAARILLPSPAVWIVTAVLAGSCLAIAAVPWLAFVIIPWWLVSLAFWRMNFPDGFARHVSGRARGTARSLTTYRPRWGKALRKSGIINTTSPLPLLVHTRSTPVYDQLRIRMVAGQRIEDFTEESDRLAQTFGALACRVHTLPNKPHWLELMFLTSDPLVNPIDPYPPEMNWQQGLPIAVCEDGQPWKLQLIGSHLLLVGATGSGKSSVLWSVIDQLIPAINDRTVKLWVLDPKGGMELAAGAAHFNRFIYDPGQFANTLEQAVRIMQTRQAALRGVTRQHTPTTTEPLIVIIIDELAALTAWANETKQRTHNALGLLLSQGRAVGITIIGAVQDPRKDTIPMRALFTTRIALRVTEDEEVRMSLGRVALNAGAKAHQIPKGLPGVGWVTIDGNPDPYRVRFTHVTDNMISNFTKTPAQPQLEVAEQVEEPTGIFIA